MTPVVGSPPIAVDAESSGLESTSGRLTNGIGFAIAFLLPGA